MSKNKIPKTAITERQLLKMMKQEIKKHTSMSAWALANDITPQQATAFSRHTQGAGLKIPEVFGYRPQIIFVPVDEELICVQTPPRRIAKNPTSKVDHTRDPIEKKGLKGKSERERVKEELKKRKRK